MDGPRQLPRPDNEDLGADRPCAVWNDEDGTTKRNECTFQQYADDCYPEDWLHGEIEFPPVPIVAGGSGDDWFAKVKKEQD